MNIGILGLGEVGLVIKKLCQKKHQVFVRTRTRDQIKNHKIDILHICIPYNEKFESIVLKNLKEIKPKFIIIDSTVKPGTTQSLYKKSKALLIHAPIIGIHPHLYKYLKVFKKPLGAVNTKAYALAKKHFNDLGVKTQCFDTPFESELAKIMSTTYYAWNIIFEKYLYSLCLKHNANFDQVYVKWNKMYNLGYKKSKPNVIRPILKHMPGPIGGHCLIPNVKILDQWLKDDFTRFILLQNQKAK